MGSSYLFECNKCDYKVESCGKLDYGMLAVLEPHICKGCNELTDVFVGKFGEKYNNNNLPKDEFDYYECEHCGSESIIIWDLQKKPCPKCDGKLTTDGKETMLWD